MKIPTQWPVVGICGYSGSGKTLLIEQLIPRFLKDDISVAVIKHDAHGLTVDKRGKDTSRFFDAGATVLAHDPKQAFLRLHSPGGAALDGSIQLLLQTHDLVLVEGHKETPLPSKIWLCSEEGEPAPLAAGRVIASLGREIDRVAVTLRLIEEALHIANQHQPLCGGILIGGKSSRMGSPKQCLLHNGKSYAERIAAALSPCVDEVCLLGSGTTPPALDTLPRLPDAPNVPGPVGGMLSAMRWRPDAAWIFAPCDVPSVHDEALSWLLERRTPGRWAVMPRHPVSGNVEPLLAWYDPRLARLLETVSRPIALANHPKTLTPTIPGNLAGAWKNINTPDEHRELRLIHQT